MNVPSGKAAAFLFSENGNDDGKLCYIDGYCAVGCDVIAIVVLRSDGKFLRVSPDRLERTDTDEFKLGYNRPDT